MVQEKLTLLGYRNVELNLHEKVLLCVKTLGAGSFQSGNFFIHCKKFWVIALPNFGQMYALPKKNGQKPNFFGYDKQKPKVDFGFCITQSTSPK